METYHQTSSSDAKNLIIHGHHLIKGSRILILEKLTSKELYQILVSSRTNKVTLVTYFETKFNGNSLDWPKIFLLPRLTTYNTYLRSFQYKILHNILFLNKKLYLSGKKKEKPPKNLNLLFIYFFFAYGFFFSFF